MAIKEEKITGEIPLTIPENGFGIIPRTIFTKNPIRCPSISRPSGLGVPHRNITVEPAKGVIATRKTVSGDNRTVDTETVTLTRGSFEHTTTVHSDHQTGRVLRTESTLRRRPR
jgi:hypothetical protein